MRRGGDNSFVSELGRETEELKHLDTFTAQCMGDLEGQGGNGLCY